MTNKERMHGIMVELAQGNDQSLLAAMSDQMQWHWKGTGRWAKSFVGKAAVVNDLLAAAKSAVV